MAQRGVNITVLAATLLATLFTFFMKDFGKMLNSLASQQNIQLFLAVCIPILFLHGILMQLTLATWIYQLSMMFRILRYWNWIVVKKIEPIIGKSGEAFLWDLLRDPPWDLALDKRVVKYFQPLSVYALCAFSLLGFPVFLFWKPPGSGFSLVRTFGLVGFPILGLTLLTLVVIHLKVVSATEAGKLKPESECSTEKEQKPNKANSRAKINPKSWNWEKSHEIG